MGDLEKVYGDILRISYNCIEAYKEVEDPENWFNCPNCGLKPLVWSFDNGRSTGCGCGKNKYEHFSIHAESIMSIVKRSYNGTSAEKYNWDELRENWNEWVKNGSVIFEHAGKRTDGRW